MRGLLITFEGIEGSGKSTQAHRLSLGLSACEAGTVLTREPGGSAVAEQIRQLVLTRGSEPVDPRAELLLFLAARSQHVQNKIRPALESGKIVICDRFTDATLAYQGGGRTISDEFLRTLNDWATGGIKPDRTYLIDMPVEIGLARARGRSAGSSPDRFESEGTAFHEAVRRRYLELARLEPERILVLRGTDSEETLAHQIKDDVNRFLSGRISNAQR